MPKFDAAQIEIGPLPEEDPPPITTGGQVWRNGFLLDSGPGYTAGRTAAAPVAEVVSVEQFTAQRREREEYVLDAAARGDPAMVYAIAKWALRHPDAPSHADLAEWMEEGRQRLLTPEVSPQLAAMVEESDREAREHGTEHWPTLEEVEREFATPPAPKRKRTPSPAMLAALERGRQTQRAKREAAPEAPDTADEAAPDGGD